MSDARRIPPGLVPGLRFATHAEYYTWAVNQSHGRFERIGGEVFAMAPERGAHLRRKASVYLALRNAIAAAGVGCQALPDGATVEVGDSTNYEPDALVNCGRPMTDDEIAAPCPVIVVEVPSPSSRSFDSGIKFADYFRVPSIEHYLIVLTDRRLVIHHQRRDDGGIDSRWVSGGVLTLTPPGIELEVDAFYVD